MLTVGIVVMVTSLVVGALALAAAGLSSSAARSAGRRARTAMALSDPEDEAAPGPSEPEQPPRWLFALLILAGAGLLLGTLMVMIASIP